MAEHASEILLARQVKCYCFFTDIAEKSYIPRGPFNTNLFKFCYQKNE
jgi:hypothetical protein